MNRSIYLLITASLLVPSLATGDGPSTLTQSDARLLPPTAIAYAEISNPKGIISTIFDHPLREKIEALDVYKQATETPEYKQFVTGRMMVEGQLQMSWREALDILLASRVTAAFDPETDGAALIIRGKDAKSMKLFYDKALMFAKLGENRDDIKMLKHREVEAYEINGAKVAAYEDRILVTNNSDLGKSILDRLIDGDFTNSLADNERFKAAGRSRNDSSDAWAFVDVEVIRQSGQADNVFHDQIDNPVLELLVGGIQSCLTETPFATASLSMQTDATKLSVNMPFDNEWIPEEREYFFGGNSEGQAPKPIVADETMFTLATHRDFAEMWLRAGDLYGTEINDGFAQADATLTTLFSGRDFGEDILGSIKPAVSFIATRQDFSEVLPRPTIKLPAFALVMELKEPERMTRELRRIYQSLIGFFNVVGAMNGQPQLEMDMDKIAEDKQLVTAKYIPEDDEKDSTDANIIHNFSPSVGFAGERFVVASTLGLARELTLGQTPQPDKIDDNTHMKLSGNTLKDILQDNREQLIAQNMMEEGNSREEAEINIDLLLQFLDYYDHATVRLAAPKDQVEAELTIALKP